MCASENAKNTANAFDAKNLTYNETLMKLFFAGDQSVQQQSKEVFKNKPHFTISKLFSNEASNDQIVWQ